MRARLVPLVLFTLAPLAAAQSLNIDVGDNLIIFPAPQNSYGAGAGQTGFWNPVSHPYSATLTGLDGSPTGVTTTSTAPYSYNYFPSTLTRDDRNFMIDIQNLPFIGGPWSWTFAGLQSGNYVLYTYAWAPENNGNQTRIHVPLSSDPAQDIGGLWSGSPHAQGVTYAVHHISITGGTFMVVVDGLNGHDGSVNGFQLVHTSGGPGVYCTAKTTSTGCVPKIGATGTPSASAGSGFVVKSTQVEPLNVGIFFYGKTGPAALPFQGGFLCVQPPVLRTGPMSAGAGGACGGMYSIDFNAYVASGVDPGLISGAAVWMQNWFRDPPHPIAGTGLSDALTFTLGP